MTHQISTWATRGMQELRALSPYTMAALSPGGSITAALGGAMIGALVRLYRHAHVRPTSLRNLSVTLAVFAVTMLSGCGGSSICS